MQTLCRRWALSLPRRRHLPAPEGWAPVYPPPPKARQCLEGARIEKRPGRWPRGRGSAAPALGGLCLSPRHQASPMEDGLSAGWGCRRHRGPSHPCLPAVPLPH